MKRALYWVVATSVLFVIWMLYVDKTEWAELALGAGAAVAAATASEAVRAEEHPRFLPHIRWMLHFWRVPYDILRDCAMVTWKLLALSVRFRRPHGKFLAIPFHAGGDNHRDAARRTLAIEFSTMSPNSIIIGIDRRRNVLLFHQLVDDTMPKVAYILGREEGA